MWLFLPLFILGNVQSCKSYIEAGGRLTPYSVSVEGYTRSDGTYVSSHSRRPSGSVAHDAPYERKRIFMGFLFFVCLVGGGGSIIFYSKMSLAEIKEYRRKLKEEEYIKNEAEKLKLVNEIIHLISFDFTPLINKPFLLKSGNSPKCKFCKKRISKEDFYITFKAMNNTHFVCMNCMIVKNSFGRYQPSSSYLREIYYVYDYMKLFSEFRTKFINQNLPKEFKFYEYELKRIFANEIKKQLIAKKNC